MRFIPIIITFLFSSCVQDIPVSSGRHKTRHVFIVVMDGARWSETWGEAKQKYIPNIKNLAAQGVMCENFWNDGSTLTMSGHAAISTGHYLNINNNGFELPAYPSVFQHYLAKTLKPAETAWVIASKDKLEALSDCSDSAWTGKFRPRTDCGINGNHSGYRHDSVTFLRFLDTVFTYRPHLVMLNFREPDMSGHAGNWSEYIKQIKTIDGYVGKLWKLIQADPVYSGKTALIVTNDHGRHLDGIHDGFISHWCDCKGCRRIFMLAIGPDFKNNYREQTYYSLVDIAPTVAKLLGVTLPPSQGKVMTTILK